MTFSAFCARCRKKVKKAERIIRYFDMFAGVGGFRAGLDLAGGFQCIGHCEIDKYADASYRAIHAPGKEEVYYPDARTIDPKELPDFDLLCGGFPCQAFSTAGRRKGFEDARGTLFFELARVVKEKRPLYLFLENVPGLLSHDRGRTNFSAQVAEEVRRHFPGKVFAAAIPRNVRLSEAPSHGMPVCAYDKYSRGAAAYDAVAQEILAKEE